MGSVADDGQAGEVRWRSGPPQGSAEQAAQFAIGESVVLEAETGRHDIAGLHDRRFVAEGDVHMGDHGRRGSVDEDRLEAVEDGELVGQPGADLAGHRLHEVLAQRGVGGRRNEDDRPALGDLRPGRRRHAVQHDGVVLVERWPAVVGLDHGDVVVVVDE